MKKDRPDQDRSLTEQTVDHIRNYILKRQIMPGDRLNVDGLARMLNTSKTPVREALNVLSAERLVVYRPRLGYSVQKLSAPEFIETSEIQQAIETHILLKLAKRATPLDFNRLESINEEIAEAVASGDSMKIFDLNKAFHLVMYERCGNEKIVSELKRIWNELLIHRYNMFASTIFLARIAEDHRVIITAMRGRDPAEITSAVERHFENGNLGAVENSGQGQAGA